MASSARTPQSAARRVAAYRKRMREAGFVQRTVWVPDVRSVDYRALIGREIQALAAGDDAMIWMPTLYDRPVEPDRGPVR